MKTFTVLALFQDHTITIWLQTKRFYILLYRVQDLLSSCNVIWWVFWFLFSSSFILIRWYCSNWCPASHVTPYFFHITNPIQCTTSYLEIKWRTYKCLSSYTHSGHYFTGARFSLSSLAIKYCLRSRFIYVLYCNGEPGWDHRRVIRTLDVISMRYTSPSFHIHTVL